MNYQNNLHMIRCTNGQYIEKLMNVFNGIK